MKTSAYKTSFGFALFAFVMALASPMNSQVTSSNPADGINTDSQPAHEYLPMDHRSDMALYRSAKFFGGQERIRKYMMQNFDYPDIAREMGIEGDMLVRFDVDKTGQISNVKVIKGIHYSLDQELCKTIEEMPAWIPAIRAGQPVRSSLVLPFKATLL